MNSALIAGLGWLSGVVGAAVVTRVYLQWHWTEIQRAHARLDRMEHKHP